MLVARFIGIQGINESFVIFPRLYRRLYRRLRVILRMKWIRRETREIYKKILFFVPLFVSLDFKSILV